MNATLDCKVATNDLAWSINNTRFVRESEINFLTNRGIFQSELVPSSDGLSSTLFVCGNIPNNVSMVCCESFFEVQMTSCTTLIVYGKLINFTESEYKDQSRVVNNNIFTIHEMNVHMGAGCQWCGSGVAISMPVLASWYKFFLVVMVAY